MPNQFTKIDNKNSLKYLYPKIAKEWDIVKNEIDIDIITYGSRRKVWWLCPKNHSYEALVKSRTILKSNCPYCSNQKAGYGNDLETNFPNIAKEWDMERNEISPSQITPGSKKKVWWLCPKNHSYSSQVYHRTNKNTGCHYCSNLKAGYGNDLETNFPNIAKEWDMERNEISPSQIMPGSEKKVWWLCPKNHSFKSAIKTKVKHPNLCPYCSNHKVGYGNDLQSTHPDLIKEWDFTKNKIDPSTVTKGHRARVWWLCPKKHSYDETIKTRTGMKTNCPFCAGQRVGYGNDLQSTHPKLVKEWDFGRNKLKPSEVTYGSQYLANWKCKYGHIWEARVYGRTESKKGLIRTFCPYCTMTPRSKEEIYLLFELKKFFDINPYDHKVKIKKIFDVDIKFSNKKIIVEFDGSYWHKDKAELDRNKTKALEKAGWTVVRVREKPLKMLSRKYNVSSKPREYKETANKVLKKLNQLGYEVKGLDKYLMRKTLVNKEEAEKYIDKLLKEKNNK